MKKICILMFAFVLFLVPSFTKAQEVSMRQSRTLKIVTVGYSVKNQEDIFGDLSLDEIDEILQKECETLLEGKYLSNSETELKLKELKTEGFIVSVVYPDRDHVEDFVFVEEEKKITPFSWDEYPISDSFRYSVGFETNSIGVVYGRYKSDVSGTYSKATNRGVISSLYTYNVGGGKFPVKDYVRGTSYAYNIFFQPYDFGTLRFGRGDFEAVYGGRIVFEGVH